MTKFSDAELRERLLPLLRRRTRFVEAQRPAGDPVLATRFGGRPAARVGEAWPGCTCGEALQFVGQFSGDDAPLFASGFRLATVFCCPECKVGGAQTFAGRERMWPGFCVRTYPHTGEADQELLVYADLLQARGDPNGELIAIAQALEGTRDPHQRFEYQRAIAELLRAHPTRPDPPWPVREADREELVLLELPDPALALIEQFCGRCASSEAAPAHRRQDLSRTPRC